MLAEATPVKRSPDVRLDEEALRKMMIRYQRADRAAAAELVVQLSPVLFRFLAHPAQSQADTEDLLQECWLRIHKARHTYRPSSPLLPWIFAVARHTRLDQYRRKRRLASREVLMDKLPERWRSAAPAAKDPKQDLLPLLDELPDSQREVLLMLKVSGMSLEEVARATSTTIGAVKQKAHRAYRKLRQLLEEHAAGRARQDS